MKSYLPFNHIITIKVAIFRAILRQNLPIFPGLFLQYACSLRTWCSPILTGAQPIFQRKVRKPIGGIRYFLLHFTPVDKY